MRDEFCRRMTAMDLQLLRLWPKFQTFPPSVQVAIRDMAWNLGVGALERHWPRFRASVDAQDWHAAAAQCTRKGIAQARNDATRALFEQL
jgi:GH24 family phage-related lysozyme (muramidase)